MLLTAKDLYSIDGLKEIDDLFLNEVEKHSPDLLQELVCARNKKSGDTSLILELAHILEEFVSKIFCVESEVEVIRSMNKEFLSVYKCKRNFVQRYALKKFSSPEALNIKFEESLRKLKNILNSSSDNIDDFTFAKHVNEWMENPGEYGPMLDIAAQYAAHLVFSKQNSILFQKPQKFDSEDLVSTDSFVKDGDVILRTAHSCALKTRTGFNIATSPSTYKALNEVHYCILCHKQARDSCSKGMVDKQGSVKLSPLQVPMTGCPLRVKISETNFLRSKGMVIAPLAVIMLDNPMCVMTGNRICNDCSRACIYQKQQPVDIPSIETHILDCVLDLPYGFEIYSLFTRWNPLSFTNVLPKKHTNKNVLVVGLGPAGIGLAHYLLNEGHNVVAIDGLKIESLHENLSGVTADNKKTPFLLIKNAKKELFENLDHRFAYGFGGVAEYGITARWNKNYLKIARILLERRKNFFMYGGVRLGSTFNVKDAFTLGFHHIALATGAGAPRIPMVEHMLVKGVMTASSFLMALHLGNAHHNDSVANLQIRLPAIVLGGGLTAVDAATEILAYYPVQVERLLHRCEILERENGRSILESHWTEEELEILREFLDHAQQIRQENKLAAAEKRPPNILKLLQKWGGVTILYRGGFNASTAYRLNSEELGHAMSEGIYFAEHWQLNKVIVDRYNSAAGVNVTNANHEKKHIAAKSIVIAVGTHENSVVIKECSNSNSKTGSTSEIYSIKDLNKNDFLLSRTGDISVFGDMHPYYKGSVVKALASAKNGYLAITNELKKHVECPNSEEFFSLLNQMFHSKIIKVVPLAEKIVEITVLSRLAACNFQPGQFYRLQTIGRSHNIKIDTECVAVTGACVDKQAGTVTLVVLDVGGSSRICSNLQIGQQVSLMGPTGSPTYIPNNENVMLIGGGVGNSVLFSIGKKMLEHGCRVLFFAGFRSKKSVFGIHDIESASDVAVFCCEDGSIEHRREGDCSHRGNVIDAILDYSNTNSASIALNSIDRILVVGSSGMMSAISAAVTHQLKHLFKPTIKVIASVNSPMQCMMKEICGQCIQRHVDPVTNQESFVYSCLNQDQCSKKVDFNFLQNRLRQNSVLEKCTSLWVSHCLHINQRAGTASNYADSTV
ncbi:MAG: FAD-dependent oxidoreductase [Aaplasma endosymbiont of Hyalomma asiaticum]